MSAEVSAELTLSVRLQGAAFQSTVQNVTGAVAHIIEDTVLAGATETEPGIAFPFGKLQLLYLLSDTNDCTVTFLGNTNTAINITGGVPYLWAVNVAGNSPLAYNVTGVTVQNLNTASGVASAVNTDVHGRIILAQ